MQYKHLCELLSTHMYMYTEKTYVYMCIKMCVCLLLEQTIPKEV